MMKRFFPAPTPILRYVKPPQGYVNQLQSKKSHHYRYAAQHIPVVGDGVPRRNHLELTAQDLSGIGSDDAARASAASAETVASMENSWGKNDTTESVGVTGDTYGKWFCENYGLTRDEYESSGFPNTTTSWKSSSKSSSSGGGGGEQQQQVVDGDAKILSELETSQPQEVMKEIVDKKVHRRFEVETLRGDGESAEEELQQQNAATGGSSEDFVVSDSTQIQN